MYLKSLHLQEMSGDGACFRGPPPAALDVKLSRKSFVGKINVTR